MKKSILATIVLAIIFLFIVTLLWVSLPVNPPYPVPTHCFDNYRSLKLESACYDSEGIRVRILKEDSSTQDLVGFQILLDKGNNSIGLGRNFTGQDINSTKEYNFSNEEIGFDELSEFKITISSVVLIEGIEQRCTARPLIELERCE